MTTRFPRTRRPDRDKRPITPVRIMCVTLLVASFALAWANKMNIAFERNHAENELRIRSVLQRFPPRVVRDPGVVLWLNDWLKTAGAAGSGLLASNFYRHDPEKKNAPKVSDNRLARPTVDDGASSTNSPLPSL